MDSNTFSVGDRIGDYEILQVLGTGGFGQVYKVRNLLSDRLEALKVLLPGHAGDSDLTDRFLREIKVQAALQHHNIAGLLGAQRQGNRILMFLELIDGVTLDQALARGRLSPWISASIMAQVLDALAYAHARGVVHRDIKPANIMIQRDGVVKLMDFGIARMAQDRKLTSTGQTIGSFHYMSPEQINALPDLDHRTDLYSLGIVMYETVTGKKPFDGPSEYTIMSGHLNLLPSPPMALDPGVPRPINDVILQAVEKDRSMRFQTASAFRAALDQTVGGHYVPVQVPMPGTESAPTVSFRSPALTPPTARPAANSRPTAGPTASMNIPPAPPPVATPVPPPPPPRIMPAPLPLAHAPAQPPYYATPAPPQSYPQPLIYATNVSHFEPRSPALAAAIAFFFPWAGALYIRKMSGRAFMLFCGECAAWMLGCISVASAGRHRHGSTDGLLLMVMGFRFLAMWLCYKWAAERNQTMGIQPR